MYLVPIEKFSDVGIVERADVVLSHKFCCAMAKSSCNIHK